jgi:anti-sigma regulatory factor (Ser/Thr protein kinase)
MYRRAVAEDLSDVGAAIAWADGLAAEHGLSDDVRYAIQLCLEEALANVIQHGRPLSEAKDIAVVVAFDAPSASVIVGDACTPFDPTKPHPHDNAEIGGRGLLLMQSFARDIAYRREGARNELVFRFGPAA